MRRHHCTITRHDIHRLVLDRLTTHLRLPDHSRRCPAAVVLQVVLAAAAAPSDQTVRTALAGGLPDRHELERRVNRALAADRPRSLAGTRQPLALDLTLRPYHGQPFRDPAEVYRSRATGGTTHFHAYATLYLARHGRRFTLALAWVRKGEPLAEVARRLLRVARHQGIRPRYLRLDRGFYSVDVIRFLSHGRHPFLMPLPLRGRPADHPGGPSGTGTNSWSCAPASAPSWPTRTGCTTRRTTRIVSSWGCTE